MGRPKISKEKQVQTISVYIPESLYNKFMEKDIKNKSKFFKWMLEQYFNENK